MALVKNLTKRNILKLEQRIQVLQDKDRGMSIADMAEQYRCCTDQIRRIIKNRQKIIDDYEYQLHGKSLYAKYQNINFMCYEWFLEAKKYNASISGPILQQKANVFAKIFNKPDFKASNGWLRCFCKRNKINLRDLPNDKASEYGQIIYAWEYNLLKNFFGIDDNNGLYETAVDILEKHQNECEAIVLTDDSCDSETEEQETNLIDEETPACSFPRHAVFIDEESSLREEIIIKNENPEQLSQELNDTTNNNIALPIETPLTLTNQPKTSSTTNFVFVPNENNFIILQHNVEPEIQAILPVTEEQTKPEIVVIDDDDDDEDISPTNEVIENTDDNAIAVPMETLEETKYTLGRIKHVALLLNDDTLLNLLDQAENRVDKHMDTLKSVVKE